MQLPEAKSADTKFLERFAWVCLAVATVIYIGGNGDGGDKFALIAILASLSASIHKRLDALQKAEKPAGAGGSGS